jgi:hypothetical protein
VVVGQEVLPVQVGRALGQPDAARVSAVHGVDAGRGWRMGGGVGGAEGG